MIWEITIIVFLMLVAIVLILLEIFLLPGITIAGVGGFLFAASGVIYAYTVGETAGHITEIGEYPCRPDSCNHGRYRLESSYRTGSVPEISRLIL